MGGTVLGILLLLRGPLHMCVSVEAPEVLLELRGYPTSLYILK